jgi:hypothetical protein
MLKGISSKQRIEFVSSVDESDPKTTFILRPLTCLEMMEMADLNAKGQIASITFYLTRSIVEVKNFSCSAVDEVIKEIDSSTMAELINELNRINHVSGEERKN